MVEENCFWVVISDAKNLIEYMHKVNLESKNLMREPEEFTMTIEQEEAFIQNSIASPHAYSQSNLD